MSSTATPASPRTPRPSRPGHRRPRPTLDRRLAPGGPGLLGQRRAPSRPAQPDLLDPLRAHRLLGLEPVVGAGAVPRPGVRHRPGRQVPAHRGADAGRGRSLRLPYTFAVARFGGRNWTIFSASLLLVPDGPRRRLLEPGVSYTHAAHRCAARGRRRRRQLRLVDDEHQRVLPGAAQGLGARPQRRRRQPRRRRGAAGRPARAGHGRRRRTRGCWSPIYIPLIVLAALGAALTMDNLTDRREREARACATRPRTRTPGSSSLLYIGTFGSFIGFGFAFGQVLQVQFKADVPHPGRRPPT